MSEAPVFEAGDWFAADGVVVSSNRMIAVVTTCDSCGFYKNASRDDGDPCRRIDCDGTVREYVYDLRATTPPTDAAEAAGDEDR